ncbi:MAG TPA: hypothetical protein ENF73_00550 [Proteobacteria bacterium]|nr:hypothetical protein [Pseudomonadota bacterium]
MPDRCRRCGRAFGAGDTSYEIKVVMKSGFDGYLKDDMEQDSAGEFKRLASEIERAVERAERDVYYEFETVLCYRCRRELEDLLEAYRRFDEPEGTVH